MAETFPTNFKEAMDFMIASIIELGSITQTNVKPSWLADTERFRSFFLQITKAGKIETARQKICTVFYIANQDNLTKPVSSPEGKLNDSFLKYDTASSKVAIKSKTSRNGLYLSFAGVFLPISEAYVKSISIVESSEDNLPVRIKILGALYCLMYHTVKDIQDHVEFDIEEGTSFSAYVSERDKLMLRNNMNELLESLDGYDKIKPNKAGGMLSGLFETLGINEKQMAEMAKNLMQQGDIKNMIEPIMAQLSSGNFDMGNLGAMAEEFAKSHTLNLAEEDVQTSEETTEDPGEQS